MQNVIYKIPKSHWLLFILILTGLYYIFKQPLSLMFVDWINKPEYSHALLIPIIAGFFVYQKKNELIKIEFNGSWLGFIIACLALILGFIGNLGTVYYITQFSVVLFIYSFILSYMGSKAFYLIWSSLLVLLFAIPLPEFLYGLLSRKLQLISSEIGVYLIRLFDISVYLEGNIIDLGIYKLQVMDACSGLRYLFPLMCFGFICSYIYKAPYWQRFIVFFTTIPITVFMNSFRVGMIGVLVNYWGIEQAEGFIHDFEGWIIFILCVGILFFEMWFFSVVLYKKSSLQEVFYVDLPARLSLDSTKTIPRKLNRPFLFFIPLLSITLIFSIMVGNRGEVFPMREDYTTFPNTLGSWHGTRVNMDPIYIDALTGMTDYIISDYSDDNGNHINFYAAYYPFQTAAGSIHSPRNCIPAGGWEITSLEKIKIKNVLGTKDIKVNRAVIEMGEHKQLTYYWFEQRGRNITYEYMAKWYQLIDSIMLNRTDGTLVRLVTPINPEQPQDAADKRLKEFLKVSYPEFNRYMPE